MARKSVVDRLVHHRAIKAVDHQVDPAAVGGPGFGFPDRVVEIEVQQSAMPSFEIIAGSAMEEIGSNLRDMMGNMFQGRSKTRRLKVPDALQHLMEEEQQRLVDMESVSRTAVQRVEQSGIVFVDEIDKIASRDAAGGHGPDVSRCCPGSALNQQRSCNTSATTTPAPSSCSARARHAPSPAASTASMLNTSVQVSPARAPG